MKTIHDFTLTGIDGKPMPLSDFAGKKLLLVNVASECGFTPQYEQLQELYEKYSDRLTIVGLPCNDFGGQEPGSEEEIHTFCSVRFGVTFPLTEKVSILGDNPHPLYRYLTSAEENGLRNSKVHWNFQKYLVDEKGRLIAVFSPMTSVFDPEIMEALEV